MRLPHRPRQGNFGPNLTPLIDIIFLLIIFFLAASHFARTEPVGQVDLPAATARPARDAPPRRLTVTIAVGPTFSVAGSEYNRETVASLIAAAKRDAGAEPLELRLRADRRVPFGEVEPLLVAAAKAGVRQVRFAVEGK